MEIEEIETLEKLGFCDKCNSQLIFIETPNLTHYGKVECPNCQKWFRWVKNPFRPKYRDKTTKCNVPVGFCQFCGRTKKELGVCETITVHHIIPFEDGGIDTEKNCLALCSACHKLAHWARLYINKHLKKRGQNDSNS